MIVINMDMPKSCYDCMLRNVCSLAHNNGWINDKRDKFCPIKCDIEDIKSEIQAIMDMYEGCEYIGDKARRDELWHVLEVIDKHIRAKRGDDE